MCSVGLNEAQAFRQLQFAGPGFCVSLGLAVRRREQAGVLQALLHTATCQPSAATPDFVGILLPTHCLWPICQ